MNIQILNFREIWTRSWYIFLKRWRNRSTMFTGGDSVQCKAGFTMTSQFPLSLSSEFAGITCSLYGFSRQLDSTDRHDVMLPCNTWTSSAAVAMTTKFVYSSVEYTEIENAILHPQLVFVHLFRKNLLWLKEDEMDKTFSTHGADKNAQ
jgi:hypothetical protein